MSQIKTKKTSVDYTNGSCNIYAIAYHKLHPEVTIEANLCFDMMTEQEFLGHSYCVDRKGIYIDAKGSSLEQYYDKDIHDSTLYSEEEIIEDCNSLLLKNFYSDINDEVIKTEELIKWTKNYLGKKRFDSELNDAIEYIKTYQIVSVCGSINTQYIVA